MGKVNYTEEDFQKAAISFKNDLVAIPVLSLKDTTKFMTVVTGVRYEELVGTKSTNARFRPAGSKKEADQVDLNLNLRALKTYLGDLTAEFDPNTAITLLLGHRASQASGEDLKDVPSAKEVLALIAKDAAEDLVYVIWFGKRDPNSADPFALFDGFDTITLQEIEAGTISEENRNLLEIEETITVDNILRVTEKIIDFMDPKLRKQECFLYCPQWFADLYNRAYKKESAGISYNDKFEQAYVEGSNKKLTLAPMEGKEGSEFLHIAPKNIMLFGCDQESDEENVKVKEYAPRVLTFLMNLFLGAQFRSVHSSQLCVVRHNTRVAAKEDPEQDNKGQDDVAGLQVQGPDDVAGE
ncbi:MAG: hypothetical protein HDS28_03750 [Bacteroides sp.]|nr:hypothetical protein [Bacteroides sp.]